MKKDLLFVMPSLTSGGGERSLVNLLSQIDYSLYNVDLFLLNHEGIFMGLIPEEVNVLPLPENYHWFARPLRRSVQDLLGNGKFTLAYNRLMFSLKNRMYKSTSIREQYSWKHLSLFFDTLPKQYDVAIGFLEKTSTYLCIEKVNARKRIGWIHIDYDKLGMDSRFDQPYFDKLDHIVTVSEECANILRKRFPAYDHKVDVIHNIVSPGSIKHLANQETSDLYNRKGSRVVILSIGRLHSQKAFELAVEACKKLVDKGYPVEWNIIGEGEERQKLTELIAFHGMEDHFKLLGLRSNPYPYLKQADIYVQTSRFEGKSIAIDEAKILHKPIVVTNFSTAKDQIEHGVDGLIVEMNPEAIAAGIETVLQDQSLRKKITDALSRVSLGTEEEIHKFYKLLG